MKRKIMIGALIAATALGTGIYYHQEIGSVFYGKKAPRETTQPAVNRTAAALEKAIQQYQSPPRVRPEEFAAQLNRLKEQFVVFAYQHSTAIAGGQYDNYMRRIEGIVSHFFNDIEEKGREELERLYGGLGVKLYQTVQGMRREICQPEIERLSEELNEVVDRHFTVGRRSERNYLQAQQSLGQMNPAHQNMLDQEIHTRNPDSYEQILRQKELTFWLEKLKTVYGVELTPPRGDQ